MWSSKSSVWTAVAFMKLPHPVAPIDSIQWSNLGINPPVEIIKTQSFFFLLNKRWAQQFWFVQCLRLCVGVLNQKKSVPFHSTQNKRNKIDYSHIWSCRLEEEWFVRKGNVQATWAHHYFAYKSIWRCDSILASLQSVSLNVGAFCCNRWSGGRAGNRS